MAIRYWLSVVQLDHVLRSVAGGFAQVGHGAQESLERMRAADGFVYYSPRTSPGGASLKHFTALGRIADDAILPAAQGVRPVGSASNAWMRPRVDWEHDVVATPIRPLLPALDFTSGRRDWGLQLRAGLRELSRHDFELIRRQMRREAGEPGRTRRAAYRLR